MGSKSVYWFLLECEYSLRGCFCGVEKPVDRRCCCAPASGVHARGMSIRKRCCDKAMEFKSLTIVHSNAAVNVVEKKEVYGTVR